MNVDSVSTPHEHIVSINFFLSEFSFIDTDESRDSRGREGTIFIPLHYFHPLTNIQTFTYKFSREVTTTFFYADHLLLLDEIYHLGELPFDYVMKVCNVCLFDDLILDFVTAI